MTREIREWYFDRIPNKNSKEFSKFLGNAHQLATRLNPKHGIDNYAQSSLRLPSVYGGRSWIPDWVGYEYFTEEEITAFWNAFVLRNGVAGSHNDLCAGHVLQSDIGYSMFVDNVFASSTVSNSPFAIFNSVLLDAMYNEQTWDQAAEAENYYLLLEHFLHPNFQDRVKEVFGEAVYQTLKDIELAWPLMQRKALAIRLRELLEAEEQSFDKPESSSSEGEDTFNDIIEEALANEDFSLTGEVTVDLTLELQKCPDELWSLDGPEDDKIRIYYTEEMEDVALKLRPNPNYEGFGKYLKQISTVVDSPAIPYYQGQDLLEEYIEQILIDGEVLGISKPVIEFQPAHIIILCDISQSTKNTGGLFRKILQAAKHLSHDLMYINHFVEVWAHTTQIGPVLYKLCDNRTPDPDVQFDKLLTVYTGANNDHIIIRHLINEEYYKFPNRRKFLWVLSDGQPIGDNSVGRTTEMAERGREKGIEVVSISLTPGVVERNNDIYGSQHNIDASHDLDRAMKMLAEYVSKPVQMR